MRKHPTAYTCADAGRGLRRRDFLSGSLAGAAICLSDVKAWAQVGPLHCVPPLPPVQPVPFTPPTTGTVRVRKSVFELTPNEVSRLKAAYAALRNVYRDDPRSWYNQALVHCWYCSGAMDGLVGQEIHGGWWFLPWHRAFLHFHEQILGQLTGDPTFALPYWDWNSTDRNRFPTDIYGGDATNPLFDSTRRVGPDDRIPDVLVGTAVVQLVMNASSFPDFGGSSDQSLPVFSDADAQQAGALEGSPHGGVHLWVTDPTNFSGAANMGSLGTAAFDPVFFAHHANIDRLWDVWANSNPAHASPSSDRWLNQPFFFYDQLQNWTAIAINQVVDTETSLRYRYQPPSLPGTPMAEVIRRTAPRLAQAAALSAPIVEFGPAQESFGPTREAKVLTARPTTLEVAVPAPARERMSTLAARAPGNRLVLRIEGVELPADRGAVVAVYINRPDATASTGTNEPGFVGTIVVVPSIVPGAGHVHGTVYRNFGFEIPQDLAASLSSASNISVTLVPAAGGGRTPANIHLRYRRVYIASR
jgi:polyphenol oxidase